VFRDIQLAGYPSKQLAEHNLWRFADAVCAIRAQKVFGVCVKHGGTAGWGIYISRQPGVSDDDVSDAKARLLAYVRRRPDDRARQDCRGKASYVTREAAEAAVTMVRNTYGYDVSPYECESCRVLHLTSQMPDSGKTLR
jgi:hypothetical protein